MALEIGDNAPDFNLPGNGGSMIKLSAYKGRKVVVYFYPKDSTPGCTTQAKDFSALIGEFEDANCSIIGISKDSVKRHDNFIAKQDLKIRLASDEEGKTIENYGVWVLKKLYGREYMGIERATFLIDETGKIKNIWHKVKVKGHVADVLEKVKSA